MPFIIDDAGSPTLIPDGPLSTTVINELVFKWIAVFFTAAITGANDVTFSVDYSPLYFLAHIVTPQLQPGWSLQCVADPSRTS